jgi:hypothetical protein
MKAIAAILLGVCLMSGSALFNMAFAEPVPFSDHVEFSAALTSVPAVLDFDNLPAGTTIADDTTAHGITFRYSFHGLPMKVTHLYATTSAPNFLGTGDGGMLHDGDDFTIKFGPSSAVGLYFITADPLLDGDITLAAGGTTADLQATDIQETLPDGSKVYFLGIVDNNEAFTSARVEALAGGFFLYNVDDIITAPIDQPSDGQASGQPNGQQLVAEELAKVEIETDGQLAPQVN